MGLEGLTVFKGINIAIFAILILGLIAGAVNGFFEWRKTTQRDTFRPVTTRENL